VDEAAVKLQQHLQWREENLPVERSEVAEVLDAGRIVVLDIANAAGNPILVFNFKRLLEVDFRQEREMALHVRAAVYCAEELISRMPSGVFQWQAIINCSGVLMPPTAFMQHFEKVFRANYPERACKIILYPIPTAVVRMVEAAMWFVAAKTREKMSFVDGADSLCRAAGVGKEELSDELLAPEQLKVPEASAMPELPPGTVVIELAAGKKSAYSHAVGPSARVAWEVHTLESTIALGLRFLPTGVAVSEPREVMGTARVAEKAGDFAAEQGGVLEFSLDNSFSYLKGKTVIITVRDLVGGEAAAARSRTSSGTPSGSSSSGS
jgi:hypothetical protein